MKEAFRNLGLATLITATSINPAYAEEPAPSNSILPTSSSETTHSNSSPSPESQPQTKPNIVVIMLDDINPIDGRLFSQELMPTVYATFEEQGIEFTQYYGETPLCCPGRADFLTGQHTQNHGVLDNSGGFPQKFNDSETLATELQDAGYSTIIVGKYLNDYRKFKDKTPLGWTYQAIPNLINVGSGYNYDLITNMGIEHHGDTPEDYGTDVYARKAAQYIIESDPNKPIFAYISPLSSHDPMTPAPRYADDSRCEKVDPWIMPFGIVDKDDPKFIKQAIKGKHVLGYDLVRVCKSLLATDDLLKTVQDALQETGRIDNTIFVFTADNGMAWGDHGLIYKSNPYATRLPLFINWEGVMDGEARKSADVISNIDIAPTLAEAAGVQMGQYPNGQSEADGISFLSTLTDSTYEANLEHQREFILESSPKGTPQIPAWWAIRSTEMATLGNYHYIKYETGEIQLYDLDKDPDQLDNLAYEEAYSQIAAQLNKELRQLKKRFKPKA